MGDLGRHRDDSGKGRSRLSIAFGQTASLMRHSHASDRKEPRVKIARVESFLMSCPLHPSLQLTPMKSSARSGGSDRSNPRLSEVHPCLRLHLLSIVAIF